MPILIAGCWLIIDIQRLISKESHKIEISVPDYLLQRIDRRIGTMGNVYQDRSRFFATAAHRELLCSLQQGNVANYPLRLNKAPLLSVGFDKSSKDVVVFNSLLLTKRKSAPRLAVFFIPKIYSMSSGRLIQYLRGIRPAVFVQPTNHSATLISFS